MLKKIEPKDTEIKKLLVYPENKTKFRVEAAEDKKVFSVKMYLQESVKKKYLEEHPHFAAKAMEEIFSTGAFHLGLGLEKDLDADRLAEAFTRVFSRLKNYQEKIQIILPEKLTSIFSIPDIVNIAITSAGMQTYSVALLKSPRKADAQSGKDEKESKEPESRLKEITFVAGNKTEWNNAINNFSPLVPHINGMRQVQALPGNYLTPMVMEKRAREMAAKFGLKISVYGQKDLEKMQAGGILAVSQGSEREPRMIVLEYNPAGASSTLALVGKGVTFDTGGISIKPSSDMHEMKYDMSGAALALHAIAAIAEKKLPLKVVASLGMVENMPDGAAFKPGDVYHSYKGLTIEVQNTDAEGRLVLGDLLAYTEKKYKPDYMINFATLTGAIVVALGPYYAGLFSNSDEWKDMIVDAARDTLEPVWPMPVGRQNREELKSDIADYNNIGGSRYGGSSSAAAFLSLFVEKTTRWAHLDIAGIGFVKKGFNVYPKGGTGYGIRLVTRLAEIISAKGKK